MTITGFIANLSDAQLDMLLQVPAADFAAKALVVETVRAVRAAMAPPKKGRPRGSRNRPLLATATGSAA
jgi:hypothetical protein